MPYVVGYGLKNRREVWTAEKPTARDALALVESLQRSDQELKFIRAPAEGEITVVQQHLASEREHQHVTDQPVGDLELGRHLGILSTSRGASLARDQLPRGRISFTLGGFMTHQ